MGSRRFRDVDAGADATPASGDAHSPQNLASAELGEPHAGHGSASGLAHSLQNLRPGSFAVPQFEQTKSDPSAVEWPEA